MCTLLDLQQQVVLWLISVNYTRVGLLSACLIVTKILYSEAWHDVWPCIFRLLKGWNVKLSIQTSTCKLNTHEMEILLSGFLCCVLCCMLSGVFSFCFPQGAIFACVLFLFCNPKFWAIWENCTLIGRQWSPLESEFGSAMLNLRLVMHFSLPRRS
jgi:hypothetical protein